MRSASSRVRMVATQLNSQQTVFDQHMKKVWSALSIDTIKRRGSFSGSATKKKGLSEASRAVRMYLLFRLFVNTIDTDLIGAIAVPLRAMRSVPTIRRDHLLMQLDHLGERENVRLHPSFRGRLTSTST